jgi:flagellar hook-associated protein 1 FlgK
MASELLNIGTSALLSYQRALDTTGHNIANVNTPGYSRQQVQLSARMPQGTADGFLGTGVDVSTILRSYDQFATGDLRTTTASSGELDTLSSLAGALDNLLSDQNSGLSPALGSFFDAVQGAANDPTSLAARQVMLSEGDSLAQRFQVLDQWMQDDRNSLAAQMQSEVQDVNQLAGSIADLNRQIIEASSRSNGQPPNDLLDQRDQLVLQLSGKVAVTTVPQADGSLNVFIGKGQSLVLGSAASQVGVQPRTDDPGQVDITLGAAGSPAVTITNFVSGGTLGGILRYRNEILDPAINELGRLAVEFGTYMNDQHHAGITLAGAAGQDLFSVAPPAVFPASGNSGSITVGFDDVSKLTVSDYRLQYDGSSWNLTRLDSGQSVPMSGSGSAADPFVADGLRITVGAGAAAGDNYVLRPVRAAAGSINTLVSDARDLALASPVRTAAAVTNTGTGQISAGTVTDSNNPAFQSVPGQLSPPVTIRFTSPTSYEVVDQSTSSVIDTGSYDPAAGADVFPTASGTDYGYRVTLSGNPAAGDTFNVGFNTNGVGDNRNALAMAGMQSTRLVNGGTASFNDAYGMLVANTGTRAHQAQTSSQVQQGLLQQAQDAWSQKSGVNLDEEAANLLRFQQAYQAAARVISVSDQVFNTLLNAVGG